MAVALSRPAFALDVSAVPDLDEAARWLEALLAALPPVRRVRVREAFQAEAAAVRIRDVYPMKLARYQTERALEETAAEVNAALGLPSREGGFACSARFVRRVMREGR